MGAAKPTGRRMAFASAVALAAFALSPTAAWSAIVNVTSLVPSEGGSAGHVRVVIHCESCNPVAGVGFGGRTLKQTTTNPAPPGDWRPISSTEVEMNTPVHEHGRAVVVVCSEREIEEPCSASTAEPSNTFTILPEVYKNEVAVGVSHVPNISYGQLLLNSPQILTFAECVTVGFGAGWNEGTPATGHDEILSWWANGFLPTAEHSETPLGKDCRFQYHGIEEGCCAKPMWVTSEPQLHLVNQEAIVCEFASKPRLSECPNESERLHELVARELWREPPTTPWNVRFTEKSGQVRARIGLPEECKGKSGAERTEPSNCPEASEREPSTSPEGCNIPPTPAPQGCVKLQLVSPPPLSVHLEYEGYLEPQVVNAGPNGLSPSTWEFEGTEKGEPALRLNEVPSTRGVLTGSIKILGFSGQELLTVK